MAIETSKTGKGQLIKGKSAYGCNLYGKSCDFVLPFKFGDKKISENQYLRLLDKGSTVNLKGFKIDGKSIEGLLRFDDNFKLKLEPKQTPKPQIKVGDTCPKCKTGKLLPVFSNQKTNDYLKEIAAKANIKKRISFHTARHTFATTVTLINGVPIESISKLLGHTKISTTQIYARILDNKLADDFNNLKNKLKNNGEMKTG